MTKQEQDSIIALINSAGISDSDIADKLRDFVFSQSAAHTSVCTQLNQAVQDNNDLRAARDHYRAELQRLQQARGKHNQRKARRIAKQLIAQGEVV